MITLIVNQKGGVSKTTNTVNLASALALRGKNVLIIDLDSQCDMTHAIGLEDEQGGIMDLFNWNFDCINKIAPNLFAISGSHHVHDNLELGLEGLDIALNKNIEENISIKNAFDHILIDCPPNQVFKKKAWSLTNIALYTADNFIIPLRADDYSVKNANNFLSDIESFSKKKKLNLIFLGFLFSNILVTEKSYKHYKRILDDISEDISFKNFIRQDVEVKNAVMKGKTIFQHKPNCRASKDYIDLSEEFLKKISS
jgi:chromosome partitioning protein